jgi:predicted signal transduction protein with EAL and GGDEF domain
MATRPATPAPASASRSGGRPANRDVQRRLTDADIALQQSKVEGRGRFHFFEDAMRSRALLSAELAQNIYDGLSRDEFEPFLQPQYDLDRRRDRRLRSAHPLASSAAVACSRRSSSCSPPRKRT